MASQFPESRPSLMSKEPLVLSNLFSNKGQKEDPKSCTECSLWTTEIVKIPIPGSKWWQEDSVLGKGGRSTTSWRLCLCFQRALLL